MLWLVLVKEVQVSAYVCEVCSTIYLNKSEAEACERSHEKEGLEQAGETLYA